MDEIVLRNKIETLDCKTNISFNLDNNINDLMIQSDHEQRLLIIDKIEKKVREENPVAGDIEVYKNAIVKGIVKPKEDFDLKYEGTLNISGNFSEDGISKIGGISPEYKRRVENRAEFNHWKKYWYLYDFYEKNPTVFPDFDFHMIYIIKYVYTKYQKRPKEGLKYLALIRYKLMQFQGNEELYSKQFLDYANNEINKNTDNLKNIIEIFEITGDNSGNKRNDNNREQSTELELT